MHRVRLRRSAVRTCFEELEDRRVLASITSIALIPAAHFASSSTRQAPALAALADPAPTIQALQSLSITGDTSDKPQSKVWSHDGKWWSALADTSGTWIWRLDGTAWTKVMQLSTAAYRADVRPDAGPGGDLVHILLFNASTSAKLASVQYVSGGQGSYQFWSGRPSPNQLTSISLTSGVESATIDLDSTGRMWLISDGDTTIEARYSDSPYSSFSGAVIVQSGVNSDDIGTVIAMPGVGGASPKIGVLWSNQETQRFGFRTHVDGTAAGTWTADEVPASQSAIDIGGGMADDHVNAKVTSDGTLYAAVKTSYGSITGLVKMGLLVRRPDGTWDDIYLVDIDGTRPIVEISEQSNLLLVTYNEGGIQYRTSPLGTINFAPRKLLMSNTSLNDVSSTKQNFGGQLVVIASASKKVEGSLVTFSVASNHAPVAVNDDYDATEDVPFTLAAAGVLANDTDQDGNTLTAALVANASHGSVQLNSNGSFTYTSLANYHGPDSFTYRASDGLTTSNVATVSLDVASVPDPPLALPDAYHLDQGATLDVPAATGVLANDSSPEMNPLHTVIVALPSHGDLDLHADGSFTYIPGPTFAGNDSFTYLANDGAADSNDALVTLSDNDAPLLDNSGAMMLSSINAGEVNNPGTRIVDLIASAGGDRITDPDPGAVEGIALIAANTSGGAWQYSLNDGGTWLPLGSPTAAAARLLPADGQARLRLVPNAGFAGTLATAITFHAWDQTAGTTGGTADATTGGGTAAFSTASGTASITVVSSAQPYLLSFKGSASLVSTGGANLPMKDADIVKLTVDSSGPYHYEMYFDGSDVGLSQSSEDVDAFDVLADGSIVLSTFGAYSVSTNYLTPATGSGPLLTGAGEDLLRFAPSSLGDVTAGTWSLYFDGSDVGLSGSNENVDSVAVLADGSLLVSTLDKASVTSGGTTISAQDEDLLRFAPTSLGATTAGVWSLQFDGSDVGLGDASSEDVDGLFVSPAAAPGALPTLFFSTVGNFSVPGASGADEDIVMFAPTALGDATSGAFGPGLTLDGSLYGLSSLDIDGLRIGSPPPVPAPAPAPLALAALHADSLVQALADLDATTAPKRRSLVRTSH